MHNFDNLQKRCQKYRLKKALIYLLSGAVLLTCLFVVFSYITKKNDTPLKHKTSQITKKTTPQQSQKIKEEAKKKHPKKTLQTDITHKDKISKNKYKKYALQFLVMKAKNIKRTKERKRYLEHLGFKNCKLTPSPTGKSIYLTCNESNNLQDLNKYIKLAKDHHIDYYVNRHFDDLLKKAKKQIVPQQKSVFHAKQEGVQKKEITTAPLLKMENIHTKKLEKKFTQTPNYNIALIIAHDYYTKGNYKNAIIWAKKANKFNNNDDKSWILYAKSLYALKQKLKAQKLLQIYLQYQDSKKVKKLLQQWEQKNDQQKN